jgi:hypothetical protein
MGPPRVHRPRPFRFVPRPWLPKNAGRHNSELYDGMSGLRFEQNRKLFRELVNVVFEALVCCVRDAHNVNIEVGFACFPFLESC